MDTSRPTITTRHKFPWERHEKVLRMWKSDPPRHPDSPRFRAYDFEVEGRYSFFESVMNVFRDKGWLDAPPADFKWAVVTVYYKAPKDPRDYFNRISEPESATEEAEAPEDGPREAEPDESNEWDTVSA